MSSNSCSRLTGEPIAERPAGRVKPSEPPHRAVKEAKRSRVGETRLRALHDLKGLRIPYRINAYRQSKARAFTIQGDDISVRQTSPDDATKIRLIVSKDNNALVFRWRFSRKGLLSRVT